jgi:hypothetical protein
MPITLRHGAYLLGELAKALKIDRPLMAMTLEVAAGEPPVVHVTFRARPEDTERLTDALRKDNETRPCPDS